MVAASTQYSKRRPNWILRGVPPPVAPVLTTEEVCEKVADAAAIAELSAAIFTGSVCVLKSSCALPIVVKFAAGSPYCDRLKILKTSARNWHDRRSL